MKEKILMLTIAVVIVLALSWAVVAMADSFNMTINPVAADDDGINKAAVQMDTDLSKVSTDASRPHYIPKDAKVVETNR